MSKRKPMRITIRLGKTEKDLLLIAAQYRLYDMLRLAIHQYLGKTDERIPLPPNVPVKLMSCATIYINPNDEEVISFMEQFPPGARSAAVKLLLRHATDRCDLRCLLTMASTEQIKPNVKVLPPAPGRQRPSNSVKVLGEESDCGKAKSEVQADNTNSVFSFI